MYSIMNSQGDQSEYDCMVVDFGNDDLQSFGDPIDCAKWSLFRNSSVTHGL